MKLAVYNDYDPQAPNDVQQFRKQAIEAHKLHGSPVVLKSRFVESDIAKGLTIHCPYDHDNTLEQGRQWDPYCFGTGYLGGFADGIITFMTIIDAPVDKIKIGKEGALYLEQEPQMIAPWTPTIGAGDLVITAIFDPNNWTIVEYLDRYLIDEVTPNTLRGHGNYPKKFVTNQKCQVSLLPHSHELYQVPVEFDYNNLPAYPSPGPGIDPDPVNEPIVDYPTDVADEDVSIVLPAEVG